MTFLQSAVAGMILAMILLDVMLAFDVLARDPESREWLYRIAGGRR